MQIAEDWRPVVGFEDRYQVSSLGRVKSLVPEGKVNNQYTGKEKIKSQRVDRYNYVSLWVNGKNKMRTVHRLVAMAFIPNPNNLPYVNHINGIKTDNRSENLEWVSPQGNSDHAVKNKLHPRGTRVGTNILTENEVREIRKMHRDGKSYSEIGEFFPVKYVTIKAIVLRYNWKWMED
jgi:hypothetical protein